MKKLITSLSLLTSLFAGPVLSMDNYAADIWFRKLSTESPKNRENLVQQLNTLISKEIVVDNQKEPTTLKDMGKSFVYNDGNLYSLITVNTLSKKMEQRPEVIDIGCGTGYMAAKMAAAGGKVHLVDVEKKTLQQAKNTIESYANQGLILRPNEQLSDVVKYTPMDIFSCKTKYKKYYEEKMVGQYQVVTLFNLLHLLKPIDCHHLIKQAYEMTAPGGYVFASAHTVGANFIQYNNKDILAFFEQQILNKEEFPGYMSFNKKIIFSGSDSPKIEISKPTVVADKREPNTHWQWIDNSWQETSVNSIIEAQNKVNLKKGSLAKKKEINLTSVSHFFNENTLMSLFKKHGFEVSEISKINKFGRIIQDKKINFDDVISLSIVAKKPSI